MTRKILIFSGILAICGASAAGQISAGQSSARPSPTGSVQLAQSDLAYLAQAGASDLYEIQSSRIAISKSRSAELRDFGQMMIDHHTKTTQQTVAAAKHADIAPPDPSLTPKQATMIKELQQASGSTFDATYLRQQKIAHEEAMLLHTNYTSSGSTPALRETARAAVPVIKSHIERLVKISATRS